MNKKTEEEYQRIAESWLRKKLDAQGIQRTPKAIADALYEWSDGKRPSTFRKMRNALAFHQSEQGFNKAADRIAKVQRVGHGEANTKKRKMCQTINEEQHHTLLQDAVDRDDKLMQAALRIAYFTGIRPVEMQRAEVEDITIEGKTYIYVHGAKVNDDQDRGIDKVIIIEEDFIFRDVVLLSEMSDNELVALKRRVSRRSATLFPDLKKSPTLYSYRHELGRDLKADTSIDPKIKSAIMGHRSQDSISVYGHRNKKGEGLNRPTPEVTSETVSKVNSRPPNTADAAAKAYSNKPELKPSRHEHDYGSR